MFSRVSSSTSSINSSVPNPLCTGSVDDDLKRVREDNDPQSLFYLNPVPAAEEPRQFVRDSSGGIQATTYSWATKIEHTVQANLGKGNARERHTMQACWDRASYRAKLLEFVAKSTPWLMITNQEAPDPETRELTDDYHADKLVYRDIIEKFFREKLPEISADKLRIIERYIAEIVLLSQGKLSKVLRFAVAYPILANSSGPIPQRPGIRVLTLTFEHKDNEESEGGSGSAIEYSLSLYQASLNKEIFDQQQFDQGLLDKGKSLVLDSTIDIAMGG